MFYYLTELLQLSRQSVFYRPALKVDLDPPLFPGTPSTHFSSVLLLQVENLGFGSPIDPEMGFEWDSREDRVFV